MAILINRAKPVEVTAPIWRCMAEGALKRRINVVHMSDTEVLAASTKNGAITEEIFYTIKRMIGVLLAKNAIRLDGGSNPPGDDSSTDEE